MSGWILVAIVLSLWVTISLVGAVGVGMVIRRREEMEAPRPARTDTR